MDGLRLVSEQQGTGVARLKERAESLEAAFLTEMLRHAGVGGAGFETLRGPFGGGIGEEQFGSFLREAMAREMVRAGGVGLTEALIRSMQGRGA